MDIVSIVVGIIGCITGIISLVIVLLQNIFQMGKQSFSLLDNHKTYYFDATKTRTTGHYNVKYCAAVSFKATNCSSYPITIDEIYLIKNEFTSKHSNEFHFEYIEINKNNNEIMYCDTEKIAHLPVKLEPFESKYLCAVFPYFNNFVETYGNSVQATMKFVTPRKEYMIDVNIPEYYSLF